MRRIASTAAIGLLLIATALQPAQAFSASKPAVSAACSPAPSAAKTIRYRNAKYGLSVTLPKSWKSYGIIKSTWKGKAFAPYTKDESGPLFLIRHPKWTKKQPRQDIPIQVFTLKQWAALENDAFHIGAAPINPSLLAKNSRYVFALPARYNFAYLTGYEEVEEILQSGAVEAYESFEKK